MNEKKYTVGIVELFFHHEVVLNLYKGLKPNFNVKIFVSEKVFITINEQVIDNSYKNTEVFIKKDKTSCEEFLKIYSEEMNNCDLIIFSTIAASFKAFSKVKLKGKTLLIIHNANAFFYPLQQISFFNKYESNLINALKIVRNLFLKRELFFKKKLLENIDFISFPTIEIQKRISDENLFPKKRICPPILFGIYRGDEVLVKKDRVGVDGINIIIPGSVHPKNKNYDLLYETLKISLPQLKFKIRLVLLGKINKRWGQQIITKFQQLNQNKINVVSFKEEVLQKDFEMNLEEADFMILPFPKTTQTSIFQEEYGKTKASGAMLYDVMIFGKPTLVSKNYPLETQHSSFVFHFDTAQTLAALIIDWVNNRKYIQLTQDSSLNNFDENNLQLMLKEKMERLIDTKL